MEPYPEKMSVKNLISHSLPYLTPSDTVEKALEVLEDYKLKELPIVADDSYVGMVTEQTLLELDQSLKLSNIHRSTDTRPALNANAHPFEAISVAHQTNVQLIPIVEDKQNYLGCVTIESLLGFIAENSSIDKPGGVLVLEILPLNYSMFEIARICENDDAVILGMQCHTTENGTLEVTLKLNLTILDSIVASFERYDYTVKEVYGNNSSNTEDIINNYKLLMNYINM